MKLKASINRPLPEGLHPDTLAVRTSIDRSQYGEHSEAIYLSSCFVQPDAETSAWRYEHRKAGYTYTRVDNPSVTAFENRLAALEGSEAAIGTSSGMAAVCLLAMTLLKSGDHVLCSRSLFGSSIGLLRDIFGKFGVETSFVEQDRNEQWQAAVQANTRLLFAETPSNPLTEVCDIASLADIAHNANALLVIDNCFATPVLQRPLEFGADLIIHSGTKFLDGHGRVVAGAICGPREMLHDEFLNVLKTAGMVCSPFNAWVVHKGMETLSLRVHQQSRNALQIAQWLEQHPAVQRVYYPGLPSHPQHELAMRQQAGTGGAILAFSVKADSPEQARKRAFEVIDSSCVISIATNLGDVRTLISHPASTSHRRLTAEQREAAGVDEGLMRLSVGLEYPGDIQDDLSRGLNDCLNIT